MARRARSTEKSSFRYLKTRPELPEDVLRTIFEYTASENRRATTRILSLVNKTVKLWAEKFAHQCTNAESVLTLRDLVEALPLEILYLCLASFYSPGKTSFPYNKGVQHLGFTDCPSIFGTLVSECDENAVTRGLLEGPTHIAIRASRWVIGIPEYVTGGSLYAKLLAKTKNLKVCVAYIPEVNYEDDMMYLFRRGLNSGYGPEHDLVVTMERDTRVWDWLSIVEEWERCDAAVAEREVEKKKSIPEKRELRRW
ncbi:hypothetical protein BDQ17DRAFT_1423175 [Cyathus striatus]|nr:hypothetical protein BDQ17DRAFT_1423175 [Cyathus striatus]